MRFEVALRNSCGGMRDPSDNNSGEDGVGVGGSIGTCWLENTHAGSDAALSKTPPRARASDASTATWNDNDMLAPECGDCEALKQGRVRGPISDAGNPPESATPSGGI